MIVVLQEGRVAERGTHDELMARRGLYHALVHTQTKEMDELVENEEEEEHFETWNKDDDMQTDESGEHYIICMRLREGLSRGGRYC